jgi:hypothetical protein
MAKKVCQIIRITFHRMVILFSHPHVHLYIESHLDGCDFLPHFRLNLFTHLSSRSTFVRVISEKCTGGRNVGENENEGSGSGSSISERNKISSYHLGVLEYFLALTAMFHLL